MNYKLETFYTDLITMDLKRSAQQAHLRLRDLLEFSYEELFIRVVCEEILAVEEFVVRDASAYCCVHNPTQQP